MENTDRLMADSGIKRKYGISDALLKRLGSARPVFILAGPTASGKTALAIQLAHMFGGEVVNADSVQMYADLPILTARPTPEECAHIPHHLYGCMGPNEETSAMAWRHKVLECVTDIQVRGGLPIITGGTGLYLNTLLDGLSPVPDIPDDVRQRWRAWVADVGAAEAHQYLAAQDDVMAQRLRPSDTQRVTRALEVLDGTGRSLAYWQAQPPAEAGLREQAAVIVLEPERAWLHERCNRRFDMMIEAGAADQVQALVAQGVSTSAGVFRALGAREIVAAQAGQLEWTQAVEDAKTATRRYAKRQSNWFRTQIGKCERVFEQDSERIKQQSCNFLMNFGLTPL